MIEVKASVKGIPKHLQSFLYEAKNNKQFDC